MRYKRWLDRVLRRAGRDAGRGVIIGAVSVGAGIPLLVLTIVSAAYSTALVGILFMPAALLGVRSLAELFRRWSGQWSGVLIESPYRPRPLTPAKGLVGRLAWLRWLVTDPATWRDLLWMFLNIPLGLLLGLLPIAFLADGTILLSVFGGHYALHHGAGQNFPAGIPIGALLLYLGLTRSAWPLRWHAQFTRSLLAPSARELQLRVGRLTDSRAGVVDASAAELRRIERDLHDGAQARLASLGMSIGLAEQLMRTDPEQALVLMGEARQHSGQALIELRTLVRGIHPPVLAERGLEGAVKALALTMPLPVEIHTDLPGRPPAPVESAVYFAIAELLANVLKHSEAEKAWVELHYARGALIAVVGDNGIGGAVPGGRVGGGSGGPIPAMAGAGGGAGVTGRPVGAGAIMDAAEAAHAGSAGVGDGGGLRGIERRLAAFDGITAVTSPSGGPTVVTMELPCVLSSART